MVSVEGELYSLKIRVHGTVLWYGFRVQVQIEPIKTWCAMKYGITNVIKLANSACNIFHQRRFQPTFQYYVYCTSWFVKTLQGHGNAIKFHRVSCGGQSDGKSLQFTCMH